MSGYPGLIGEWMSGEIAEGCPRAGQRVTGKVVGGSLGAGIAALIALAAYLPTLTSVSVMRMEAGPAELTDGYETITVEEHLTPVGCLRAGEWIAATAGMTHMAAA